MDERTDTLLAITEEVSRWPRALLITDQKIAWDDKDARKKVATIEEYGIGDFDANFLNRDTDC